MAWVPGGSFRMGSEDFYPEERPVRRVEVDGFWIDLHPVTSPTSASSSPRPATGRLPSGRSTRRTFPARSSTRSCLVRSFLT